MCIYVYEFARRRNGKIKIVIKNRYVFTIIYYFFITGSEHNIYLILYVLYYYYYYIMRTIIRRRDNWRPVPKSFVTTTLSASYVPPIHICTSYIHAWYNYILYYRFDNLSLHIAVQSYYWFVAVAHSRRRDARVIDIYIIINIYKRGVYAMHYYAYNCKDDRRKKKHFIVFPMHHRLPTKRV